MSEFEVGDFVYGSNWCFGEIVQLDNYGAWVEFDTGTGGGTSYFEYEELVLACDI